MDNNELSLVLYTIERETDGNVFVEDNVGNYVNGFTVCYFVAGYVLFVK